ncbi:MAG: hypothetical protein ACRBDL_11460 [Alphaproteobacteria bacterium]
MYVRASTVSHYDFPLQIDSYDYRIICFFIACVLYAVLGSPTPDTFGYVEVLIGVLLALSVGAGRMRDALLQPINRIETKKRYWKSAGQAFLLYGLSVPLLVSVLSGYAPKAIMRDILPFLFLFLPLLLLQVIRARPYYFRVILCSVCLIGILFSIRSVSMRYALGCPYWCGDELLYLENMPTVLFSCLFLIGVAMHRVARCFSLKSCLIAFSLLALSLVPLVSMILTLQRASVGAVFLYVLVLLIYHVVRSPERAFGVVVVLLTAFSIAGLSFYGISSSLLVKTQKVGLNMRPQEFYAVWQVVTASPISFLFGIGWGGSFASPAVGGLNVNFTHNFFSSIFLKTGVLGIIFGIAYVSGILERSFRVILKNPTLGLAIFMPVMIDITLYASFKSLDFGLMLLLISGSLVYLRQSESKNILSVHA